MKTELMAVGKTDNPHFIVGIEDYVRGACHYVPFNITVTPELKNSKNKGVEQQKMQEGQLILKKIEVTDAVVLLDEHGKEFQSIELVTWMERKQQSVRKLVSMIGGPYGFSPEVYGRTNEEISSSKLTFSHQMVRLIFVEQLYRACTILKGEPCYHEQSLRSCY